MFPASVERQNLISENPVGLDPVSDNSVGLDSVPDNSILVPVVVETVQFVGVTIQGYDLGPCKLAPSCFTRSDTL